MENDFIDYTGIKVTVTDLPSDEEIMQNYEENIWIDPDKKVLNEHVFARAFKDINHLQYSNGLFYTREGKKSEEIVNQDIALSLEGMGIAKDVGKTTRKLSEAVKLHSTVESLNMDENVIPFHNGDFIVDRWEFHLGEFSPVPYRIPTSLKFEIKPTPYFDKWVKDLFYPEDKEVIMEFLGYCLVFSTKAQKALFLVGDAGAGKGGIGKILEAMLGGAMLSIPSTQEFLQDKFKLPELENKLVMYDDDLDSAALEGTGLYKKLITNDIKLTADRKYGQPFEFTPRIKLIASCNEMLTSSNDLTEGFYRRLLPVLIKPKRADFVPDLDFYSHLQKEREGIAQSAIAGLQRLIANKWVLPETDRTKNYLAQKRSIENPMPDFMQDVFEYSPLYPGVPTTEIMRLYEYWCRKNSSPVWKPRQVQTWLADNAEKYKIVASQHIQHGDKRVRGYMGMRVKGAWSMTGKIHLTL